METIAGAWKFLLALGAGTGSVYILRWFWWRINAWSEISAMLASFFFSILLQFGFGMDTANVDVFAQVMLITVAGSSLVWITVTLLTPPETEATLLNFYRKVRPGGNGWKPISRKAPEVKADTGLGRNLLDWAVGILLIYMALFGAGKLILGEITIGLLLSAGAIVCFAYIFWDLKKRDEKTFGY